MYDRRTLLQAIGAGATAALAGCSVLGDSSAGARTVTDDAGRDVSLPESVDRVVAVGPGALRQVAYLGATDRVVGVEDAESGWIRTVPYNMANPSLREKRVTGSAGPNAGGNGEEILAADPDVIFFYGDTSRAETLQSQTDTPVVALELMDLGGEATREGIYETWRLVGDVLDLEDRAAELETFVEETVADLRDRTADLPDEQRVDAYAGAVSYKGAHGLATTRKRFPPFAYAGVDNVASGIGSDSPSVQLSEEQLLEWDPEAIFVDSHNLDRAREDLQTTAAYDELTAVSGGEIYTLLPHASYNHNYGSILANAYFVGTTLYPDRFDDADLSESVDSIFETLLGAPLYDDLLETHEAYQRLGDLDG
ncbi:ABC transporter substrate-binding protein [Halapricum hydrolyticum]|uniref:ABC transporter substrate-binding protein n=1 Tax=Halapricum hydrolyticum TaxID=2979991 RepID=A0AAE3I9C1_9EURY|nr:ABC transporter substrate-binding protein [Halapricum hydrolyticum]MCU4718246.1 ABC transporter substrate-binding protein [Halapricum hydrolyticum]MCU4726313.1 ABC transporter substrate-binding protein [Halapricum hydrolyticum]